MSLQPFPALVRGWLPHRAPIRPGPSPRRKPAAGRGVLPYLGPAFVVMVGCVDPGNWATDYAAGGQYGYQLLWVVALSTLVLLFVQHLSARLGMLSGRSLAQLIHDLCPRPLAWLFGGSIVVASSATALAEYLGAALGLNILFGLPLLAGTILTAAVVVALLLTQRYRRLEWIVFGLLAMLAAGYAAQLWFLPPDTTAAFAGLRPEIHDGQIFLVLGIVGATIMPHNVYLHSALVQTRDWSAARNPERSELFDTSLGMLLGGVLNMAMLLVAAVAFTASTVVPGDLLNTHALLGGVSPIAGRLFGAGLLVAGLGSAVTSSLAETTTIAGLFGHSFGRQPPVVGAVHLADPVRVSWLRKLGLPATYRLGLLLAIVPTFALIGQTTNPLDLLVWSQVVLALQLPLTLVPLIWFSRKRAVLGAHRVSLFTFAGALMVAAGVTVLNILFLIHQFGPPPG